MGLLRRAHPATRKRPAILLAAGILAAGLMGAACRSGAQVPEQVDLPVLIPTRSASICQNDVYPAGAPAYIDESALPFYTRPSGLRVHDELVGDGGAPMPGATVRVRYSAWFPEDGCLFDTSVGSEAPFEFQVGLNQVIPGWEEALATMNVGGIRRIVVPPQLAYGAAGFPGAIPPNSTLAFYIELVGMDPPEQEVRDEGGGQ